MVVFSVPFVLQYNIDSRASEERNALRQERSTVLDMYINHVNVLARMADRQEADSALRPEPGTDAEAKAVLQKHLRQVCCKLHFLIESRPSDSSSMLFNRKELIKLRPRKTAAGRSVPGRAGLSNGPTASMDQDPSGAASGSVQQAADNTAGESAPDAVPDDYDDYDGDESDSDENGGDTGSPAAPPAPASDGTALDVVELQATDPRAVYYGISHAARIGHTSCLRFLLAQAIVSNARILNRRHADLTPLMIAIINERPRCVKLLLTAGADVTVARKDGKTAIILAASQRSLTIMQYTLTHASVLRFPSLAKAAAGAPGAGEGTSADAAAPPADPSRSTVSQLAATPPLSPMPTEVEIGDTLLADRQSQLRRAVQMRDKLQRTALHYAAVHGRVDIVWLLIRHGASPYALDHGNSSPFHAALYLNVITSIHALLAYDPFLVDTVDAGGFSPMRTCAFSGRTQLLYLLYEAVRARDPQRAWRLLTDRNPLDGYTVVHYAAFRGHADTLAYLISLGMDVNPDDARNMRPGEKAAESTPLHLAANKGNLGCIRILLDAGANCRYSKELGSRVYPIHSAALNEHLEATRLIAEHAPDLAAGMHPPCTATVLHAAASGGNVAICRMLVEEFGAARDLEAQLTRDKTTPLSVAASEGKIDAVKYLVSMGASVFAIDVTNSYPIHWSARNGHLDCTLFLYEEMTRRPREFQEHLSLLARRTKRFNDMKNGKLAKSDLFLAAEAGSAPFFNHEADKQYPPAVVARARYVSVPSDDHMDVDDEHAPLTLDDVRQSFLDAEPLALPETSHTALTVHHPATPAPAAVTRTVRKVIQKNGMEITIEQEVVTGDSSEGSGSDGEDDEDEWEDASDDGDADNDDDDDDGWEDVSGEEEEEEEVVNSKSSKGKTPVGLARRDSDDDGGGDADDGDDDDQWEDTSEEEVEQDQPAKGTKLPAPVTQLPGESSSSSTATASGPTHETPPVQQQQTSLARRSANAPPPPPPPRPPTSIVLKSKTVPSLAPTLDAADVSKPAPSPQPRVIPAIWNSLVNRDQRNVLHVAARKGEQQTLESLLSMERARLSAMIDAEYGPCPKLLNAKRNVLGSRRPMHVPTVLPDGRIRPVIDDGINAGDLEKATPLHLAVCTQNEGIIKTLLKFGAFVDTKDINGCTPLHIACRVRFAAGCKMLFQHGANPFTLDHNGDAAAHVAIEANAIACLEVIGGKCKAALSVRNRHKRTPLLHAAYYDSLAMASYIVAKCGSSAVNVQDKTGATALHYAVAHGDVPFVEFLLRHNPFLVQKEDNKGWFPITVATSSTQSKTRACIPILSRVAGTLAQTMVHSITLDLLDDQVARGASSARTRAGPSMAARRGARLADGSSSSSSSDSSDSSDSSNSESESEGGSDIDDHDDDAARGDAPDDSLGDAWSEQEQRARRADGSRGTTRGTTGRTHHASADAEEEDIEEVDSFGEDEDESEETRELMEQLRREEGASF